MTAQEKKDQVEVSPAETAEEKKAFANSVNAVKKTCAEVDAVK